MSNRKTLTPGMALLFAAATLPIFAAAWSSTIPTVDLQTGAKCACNKLAAKYDDASVLVAQSTNYSVETTAYWDVRSDMDPRCIFLPNSADEVSDAMSIFYTCGTQFAIRGGGHMNNPGSNNIEQGVLLALNNLDAVTVSADNKTVDAGPGATWYDVYAALAPSGGYAIGGRLKTIGVPGLSLIGGFHYFINKYGYAMDNILSYDVVLGNGTQVVADATSDRDLFWALKGGANNFGVVTKFKIKSFPISTISTTIQAFDEDQVPAFLKAATNLALHNPPNIAAGSVITVSYNSTTKTAAASLLGVQEGSESPPSRFDGFSAIESISTTNTVLSPIEWHANLDTPFQMFRVQFAQRTMRPDYEQIQRIYDSWRKSIEDLNDVPGLYPTFVLNHMPKSSFSPAKHNGVGNTWGFDDDEGYIIWQFSTGWDDAVQDIRVTNWARKLVDYWHADNLKKGLGIDFLYAGDAGEYQDVMATYPPKNIEKMRETREKYDPAGVFTRLNWGGFKLGGD